MNPCRPFLPPPRRPYRSGYGPGPGRTGRSWRECTCVTTVSSPTSPSSTRLRLRRPHQPHHRPAASKPRTVNPPKDLRTEALSAHLAQNSSREARFHRNEDASPGCSGRRPPMFDTDSSALRTPMFPPERGSTAEATTSRCVADPVNVDGQRTSDDLGFPGGGLVATLHPYCRDGREWQVGRVGFVDGESDESPSRLTAMSD